VNVFNIPTARKSSSQGRRFVLPSHLPPFRWKERKEYRLLSVEWGLTFFLERKRRGGSFVALPSRPLLPRKKGKKGRIGPEPLKGHGVTPWLERGKKKRNKTLTPVPSRKSDGPHRAGEE